MFNIEVTRFAGPTSQDGTLINATQLVQAGVISPFATLVMPAFDVDVDASVTPPTFPERDRVFFNGTPMNALSPTNSDFLQGANDIWRLNSFQIPIERVKFPSSRGTNGGAPEPAMNQIRIDIDTANTSEVWCTAIDWAALSIKITSPVILIHGNSSDGGFYARHQFTDGLSTAHLLWDNSINFAPNATSISVNARRLAIELPRLVAEYGVDSVHVVCHSKGGLDTREYLATYQPRFGDQFQVLSYTSLSTPHNGSVLADLVVSRYTAPVVTANSKHYVGFPSLTETVLDWGASLNGGYNDLRTTSCAAFNAVNVPRLPTTVVFNTIAADMDQNGNGRVDGTPREWAGLELDDPSVADPPLLFEPETILDVPYQILRNTSSITVATNTNFLGWTTATITSLPNANPLGNDVLVTIPSGQGQRSFASVVVNTRTLAGANGRNHSSVADAGVAAIAASWIVNVERSDGDLK